VPRRLKFFKWLMLYHDIDAFQLKIILLR